MFIFWGSRTVRECRGFVADHCGLCGQPRSFRVDYCWEESHLYFVPTGRRVVSMTRACLACSQVSGYEPTRYASLLPPAMAAGHPFETLLRNTNPRLWHLLRAEVAPALCESGPLGPSASGAVQPSAEDGQPELGGAAAPRAGESVPSVDHRGQWALQQLRQVDPEGLAFEDLRTRLGSWPHLSLEVREALLRDVADGISGRMRTASALACIRHARDTAGPRSAGQAAFLGAVALVVAGAFAFSTDMTSALTSGILVGTGIVGVLPAFVLAEKHAWRNWFTKTLVPAALHAGIPLSTVLSSLDSIRTRGWNAQTGDLLMLAARVPDFRAAAAQGGESFPPEGTASAPASGSASGQVRGTPSEVGVAMSSGQAMEYAGNLAVGLNSLLAAHDFERGLVEARRLRTLLVAIDGLDVADETARQALLARREEKVRGAEQAIAELERESTERATGGRSRRRDLAIAAVVVGLLFGGQHVLKTVLRSPSNSPPTEAQLQEYREHVVQERRAYEQNLETARVDHGPRGKEALNNAVGHLLDVDWSSGEVVERGGGYEVVFCMSASSRAAGDISEMRIQGRAKVLSLLERCAVPLARARVTAIVAIVQVKARPASGSNDEEEFTLERDRIPLGGLAAEPTSTAPPLSGAILGRRIQVEEQNWHRFRIVPARRPAGQ